jgi:S1-C subfamily serine protease
MSRSHGVVISDIDPDGVAAQKGLQAGRAVNKPADVSAALAEAKKDNHRGSRTAKAPVSPIRGESPDP